jgi:8-hydroxy-5-deazaflavin:NADPH oxidoreductase
MTKVAIIGTGNVGGALGKALAGAGHQVTYAAQSPEHAQTAAAAVGGTAAASAAEAAAGADIIVLAVPFTAAEAVAKEIASAAAGKVVIDTTNPLKPDYSGLATVGGPSGAERISAALPGAKVVKAFNTMFAGNQGNPTALGQTIDALYAADDEAAAATFAALASAVGFRPVKVGPLAAATELEAIAWLNIRLQLLNNGAWNTAVVLVAPPQAALAA